MRMAGLDRAERLAVMVRDALRSESRETHLVKVVLLLLSVALSEHRLMEQLNSARRDR